MVFEDVANIFLLCTLMGIGAVVTTLLLFGYLAAMAIMEDHFD